MMRRRSDGWASADSSRLEWTGSSQSWSVRWKKLLRLWSQYVFDKHYIISINGDENNMIEGASCSMLQQSHKVMKKGGGREVKLLSKGVDRNIKAERGLWGRKCWVCWQQVQAQHTIQPHKSLVRGSLHRCPCQQPPLTCCWLLPGL